ncbi:sirohydrochlorin cobaltochelatase [Clostridium sp. YIM B02551]|uniref:sirohydrochlorin cobaltochelatase n=1 Tax=Clostridium sp. YIM B02551 TaxID=2910679 RepID=UPI001EEAACC1|nr:sirohydrochlorin cobaltochelatase [Clostridium sp. YIM B02551]
MKKAIIVLSFGTSYLDALEKNIVPMEREVEERFGKEYKVIRAFTSHKIIKKLKKEHDISIFTPEEALDSLLNEGYEEVTIQPLHIIPGQEFDYIKKVANIYKCKFNYLRVGRPLLYFQSDEVNLDYDDLVYAISNNLPKNKWVILAGHGTHHPGNSCYGCFQNRLRDLDHGNIIIATIEAYPSLENTIKYLKDRDIKSVVLAPFLLVVGDHARKDIFSKKEDSWASTLKGEGIEVEEFNVGLGEYEEVRSIYMKHLEDALSGKFQGFGENLKG